MGSETGLIVRAAATLILIGETRDPLIAALEDAVRTVHHQLGPEVTPAHNQLRVMLGSLRLHETQARVVRAELVGLLEAIPTGQTPPRALVVERLEMLQIAVALRTADLVGIARSLRQVAGRLELDTVRAMRSAITALADHEHRATAVRAGLLERLETTVSQVAV